MPTSYRRRIAQALASAFLDEPWSQVGLTVRGRQALGAHYAFLPALVRRTLRRFPEAPHAKFDKLLAFIAHDGELNAITIVGDKGPRVRATLAAPVTMAPREVEGALTRRASWNLPILDAPGDIASWLSLPVRELEWLADLRGLERVSGPRIQSYTYRWLAKRTGGARLLEAPKSRLKAVQRRILHEILDRVPTHDAAHGFVKGRGIATHAATHAGRAVVVRMDLADFFLSIPRPRVSAMFRTYGYAAETARTLAGLCTNCAPARGGPAPATWPSPNATPTVLDIAALHRARQRYATPHLPQGAPTSPALANLAAFGLDVRLAAAAGSVGAVYTRYADDLVFSGDEAFEARARRFVGVVKTIASDEGFEVNPRKTRVMPTSVQQSITGLVVNTRATVPRAAYERIEATLFNAARRGAASQNRGGHADFRTHLGGVVAWVTSVDAARGARLRELYEQIDWAS